MAIHDDLVRTRQQAVRDHMCADRDTATDIYPSSSTPPSPPYPVICPLCATAALRYSIDDDGYLSPAVAVRAPIEIEDPQYDLDRKVELAHQWLVASSSLDRRTSTGTRNLSRSTGQLIGLHLRFPYNRRMSKVEALAIQYYS